VRRRSTEPTGAAITRRHHVAELKKEKHMRIARKLFMVAILTATTMAFGASSASAVEVADLDTEVHCTEAILTGHAVDGGCLVEAVGERETLVQGFVMGVGFVTVSACEDHFEAAISEDGHGYLYNATTTGHTGPPLCTRTQCDEEDMTKIPWEVQLTATDNMEITFCLRTIEAGEGAAGTPCHTDIGVETNNATGGHEFWADGVNKGSCENLGGGVRVIGHWNVIPSGSHPAITIE
jgi:hypothetical protein